MLRVRVPVTLDGSIHLDPPPAGAVPGVGAGTAFATARRAFGDPAGTARTRVALTRYTNDNEGSTNANGPGVVGRLSWAVVDYGGSCRSVGPGPVVSGPPVAPVVSHQCLTISVVDATTERPTDNHQEGGRGVRDISLR